MFKPGINKKECQALQYKQSQPRQTKNQKQEYRCNTYRVRVGCHVSPQLPARAVVGDRLGVDLLVDLDLGGIRVCVCVWLSQPVGVCEPAR